MNKQIKDVLSAVIPLIEKKDHSRAISALKEAVDSGLSDEIILGMLASEYANLGMLDRAIVWYEKIVDVNPENYLAIFQLGMILYQSGEYARAIEYWEAIGIQQGEFISNYWIARAYLENNNKQSAKPYIDTAFNRMPKDHDLYKSMIEVRRKILEGS